jgi:hypothetical protein
MFRWFQPPCPVNSREKAWIERRLSWLTSVFGLQRLRQAVVILPTPEFFPEPYDATEADVRVMLDRVCIYMGIAPERVELSFFDDGQGDMGSAAGRFVGGTPECICINRSQLSDPMALVATLAHELAHALLLGDGRITPEEADQEWLTDLLPVFLGLGVFGANSVIRESYTRMARAYTWRIQKQGYLSEPMYGHALAVFAWAREEFRPEWVTHLRPNVRAPFTESLRYLDKTGDCLFEAAPRHTDSLSSSQRADQIVEQLQSPFGGARIDALWELRDLGEEALPAEPAMVRALKDTDPFVRAEAARLLAGLGPAIREAVEPLLDVAYLDSTTEVRAQAIEALGCIGARADLVVPALISLLQEQDLEIRQAAVCALRSFGPAAAEALPAVLRTLSKEEELAEAALETLEALGPAAREAAPELRQLLQSPEHRTIHASIRQVLRALEA